MSADTPPERDASDEPGSPTPHSVPIDERDAWAAVGAELMRFQLEHRGSELYRLVQHATRTIAEPADRLTAADVRELQRQHEALGVTLDELANAVDGAQPEREPHIVPPWWVREGQRDRDGDE